MPLVVHPTLDEVEEFGKLAVAVQAADGHQVPVVEPAGNELLVLVSGQSLHEQKILSWDRKLQARWLDDDLKVCVRLLNVQTSDQLFRQLFKTTLF